MSSPHPQIIRDRAAAALGMKRYEEAIKLAMDAIALEPTHFRGHAILAQAFLGKHANAEAQRAAEAGLAVAPDQEWLHRLRSIALRELGQPAQLREALSSAEESVRLAPALGFAHWARALALGKLKRVKEAREAAAKALELDPTNADIHRAMGDLYLDGEPKTAEKHYRAALAIEPNDALGLNNLGVALLRQRRAKEAVVAFKSAVILDPTMGAAKRNTHSTVQKLFRRAGLPLFAGLAYVGISVIRLGGDRAGSPAFAAGVALIVGAVLLGVLWNRRRQKALLQKDPQLYEIFRKLDADKRAGRL